MLLLLLLLVAVLVVSKLLLPVLLLSVVLLSVLLVDVQLEANLAMMRSDPDGATHSDWLRTPEKTGLPGAEAMSSE